MSRLVYLSLLFLLVIAWCDHAVGSHRTFKSSQLLNECKCKVMPNKTLVCLRQAMPRTKKQKLNILKCLCKKHRYERKLDVNLQRICKKKYGDISIPLTLA